MRQPPRGRRPDSDLYRQVGSDELRTFAWRRHRACAPVLGDLDRPTVRVGIRRPGERTGAPRGWIELITEGRSQEHATGHGHGESDDRCAGSPVPPSPASTALEVVESQPWRADATQI